jgi:hypothetical protein
MTIYGFHSGLCSPGTPAFHLGLFCLDLGSALRTADLDLPAEMVSEADRPGSQVVVSIRG